MKRKTITTGKNWKELAKGIILLSIMVLLVLTGALLEGLIEKGGF